MLIRPASSDDVPSIRALEQQTDTAAHWAKREYDALFSMQAPPRIALVAVEEDAVLGFVIARCTSSEWEIENVVVAREKRNRGIGIQLVQEVLLSARSAGATSVLLEVRESNAAARGLYEKLGFNQQGRRSNYYRQPDEDALLLCFSITDLRQFGLEAE